MILRINKNWSISMTCLISDIVNIITCNPPNVYFLECSLEIQLFVSTQYWSWFFSCLLWTIWSKVFYKSAVVWHIQCQLFIGTSCMAANHSIVAFTINRYVRSYTFAERWNFQWLIDSPMGLRQDSCRVLARASDPKCLYNLVQATQTQEILHYRMFWSHFGNKTF